MYDYLFYHSINYLLKIKFIKLIYITHICQIIF